MVVVGSMGHTLKHMLGFLGSKNVDEINSKSREMMEVAAGSGGRSSENAGNGPILTMVMDDMGESLYRIENPRDLSEMVQNSEKVQSFILKMFQKAYVGVDENGTEAVAITQLDYVLLSATYRLKIVKLD
ncbi:hypothetical protein RHSIM_Rhsim06G0044500 [Rhododendron simsii]|uniref:Uncharacterized protein n=1 Tax=Rhododendron simsii TaxID=118357 RepID=A0A834LJP7_RHOSS|nr:hypothetical protein RHSIM_Rhsim06G0044500 [Rhododendron simsii]